MVKMPREMRDREMREMRDIHHQPVAGWYLLVGRNLAITAFGY
jgi:hypothetical protein